MANRMACGRGHLYYTLADCKISWVYYQETENAMAKIPFTLDAWLKDKSQKIETRNGRPVHYIGLDRAGWQVFEIFRKNGTSEYRTYHNSYMYCGPEESTYDLFIVTPDPEMTEFEKACMKLYNEGCDDGLSGDKLSNESVKESASELLSLAKQQPLQSGELLTQEHHEKLMEILREECTKDLPRWKRSKPESGRNYVLMFKGGSVINTTDFREDGRFYYEDGESYCDIHYNDSCVMWMYLDELLQLPGFKEDESYE